MFTRMLTPSATLAALLLGTVSHNAAAMDEIVVNGAEVLALLDVREQVFRSEMEENKRSVDEWIKATLQNGVNPTDIPKVNVASAVQKESVLGLWCQDCRHSSPITYVSRTVTLSTMVSTYGLT